MMQYPRPLMERSPDTMTRKLIVDREPFSRCKGAGCQPRVISQDLPDRLTDTLQRHSRTTSFYTNCESFLGRFNELSPLVIDVGKHKCG